ncbi:DUF1513 domain-containing protein [Aestuariibius sp. HNIBRBA575]|uniref:DUF1513 domain-containing protein n=1 Tax=Aestuariibius sp. HNIBRBA575 TaxID=3233343 RepID=UPI0034A46176
MTGRRHFLGGLLAAGFMPCVTWADAGSPTFLSAAATRDGKYVLCGIGADLALRFTLPLPARGHAAAAHPTRPEAVAFARRPGTFAIVLDCSSGAQLAELSAPDGRHFYGHGTFSSDGRLLFTTENDFESGRGRIGAWDSENGYHRVAEWDSGGIGPHDIKRLPGTDVLVVANGGIETHPDTGRTKLNIPTMAPNLAYIDNGTVIESAALPDDMHKNSIRHLAVNARHKVAIGMQWQGDGPAPALVATHQRGQAIQLLSATPDQTRRMNNYIGSVAYSGDGLQIVVTSPRGGMLQVFDVATGRVEHVLEQVDISGVAASGRGFVCSAGTGELAQVFGNGDETTAQNDVMWDNHLIRV